MYKQNKNGKILNVLLGIIALFIIIFIIAWVVNKGTNSTNYVNYDQQFKSSLEKVQETAKDYFANDLPEEIGDTSLLSLEDMYELDLTDKLTYGKTACDETLSYISITKINSTEYRVKSNLVCGEKTDNLVEKVTANTIVEDENGDVIVDDEKTKDIELNIENSKDEKDTSKAVSNDNKKDETTVTSSDGKTPDVVKCTGPICTFKQIETTCNTTYEYEYVKRNVSCPAGYVYKNGTCAKTISESTTPVANYTEETTKVTDAKVNNGSSYKVYANPIVTGGVTSKYCEKGTLASDGYCYEYANKTTTSSTSCPTGYTLEGNACYKYADVITSSSTSCPAGYSMSGNACYKYADLVTSSSTSCPAGYSMSGNACYKYADLITSSSTSYSCPAGYNSSGSGSSLKCYKTVSAVKTYTAWGNPTKTYQTFTKESTYTKELSKKVLVGTGKKAGKTIYTYSTYSRKSKLTCAAGTLSGSTCYVYANNNASTTTTSSCPSGYTKSGNTCYIKTNVTTNTTSSCPSGYTQSGSTCYVKHDLITSTSTSCPSGYTKSGNTCYIKKDINTTSSSTCPAGYTNNGNNCYIKTNAKSSTTEKVYSCPSGYTKSGIGANTTCSITKHNADTYYCENANATLKGKLCYIKVPAEFKEYSCPAGYTYTNNTCSKTTTETATPIWTTVDSLYSSASSLAGYQRTGAAKFVTKCTRINTISK